MNVYFYQIAALSRATIIENFRNKSFATFLVTGGMLFIASVLLGRMAVGDFNRVILDAGFWIIGMFGLASSLFFFLNAIQGEIRRKTIYILLSRPMKRWVFILGKFLGILAVLLMVYLALSTFFISILYLNDCIISIKLIFSLASLFFEWCVLASFSLLLSVFTSNLLHGIFLTSLYFIGHWSNYLNAYAQNTSDLFLKKILIALYTAFPNLEALNYRSLTLYDETPDFLLLFHSFLTGSGWIMTAIAASIVIFNRKNLV